MAAFINNHTVSMAKLFNLLNPIKRIESKSRQLLRFLTFNVIIVSNF